MFKSYLRNILFKILWRILKLAVIAIFAFITWEKLVKEHNVERGRELYEEGKEVYKDVSGHVVTPSYEVREDSSYIYLFVK